jgi:L-aspartate oxidase
MLASGGAGQVYPNTTNPHVATGDGMAMAFRAGAAMENMEFVQFHPTALYQEHNTEGRTFLITEAVRGEGGLLFNQAGERFMPQYDARLELAPRDVVARAIHDQVCSRGEQHVWLDISHKPRAEVLSHFPNIAAKCATLGIDITQDPIPVVPAQHYMCGGVHTGLVGETTLQGLYACGEVTCSGLHGANRLASNSLLEGLVFADRAAGPSVAHAEYALKNCGRQLHYAAASADFSGSRAARPLDAQVASWAAAKRRELQQAMWSYCGIVRTRSELKRALDLIAGAYVEVRAVYKSYGTNTELVELMNLVTVSELIVSCALQRKESRGLHYLADYPMAVEEERRASMIDTALNARYDLSGLKSRVAAGAPAGLVGVAVGGSGRVGGKAAVQREVTVRSAAQDAA